MSSAIDPDAFVILLRNLIENALKYGAADQTVEVSLTDQALLWVVNGGPAVPEPVLQRLTERFVRGHSEISGSGLGLAITKTIVQGVNARMKLVSPAAGRQEGFDVCVWLPLAQFLLGRQAPLGSFSASRITNEN